MRGEVNGYPCLLYADRVDSVSSVVRASRRWTGREYLVQADRRVTFDELEAAVASTAECLRDAGVHAGDCVALFAANSPDWVSTFFGVLQLGAIAVPFNGWWSETEVSQACDIVAPAVIVADSRRAAKLPAGSSVVDLTDLTEAHAVEPSDLSEEAILTDENAPAMVLFTAGTTSYPKGAVLTHRALLANLQTLLVVSRKLPDQIPDDIAPSVTLVGLPLFHMGAIQLMLVPLMTGSKLVFLEGKFDAETVLRLIESERVTMFSGVPTMMERILRHPDLGRRDLSSLRTVVLGGSPVSQDLLEQIGSALPNARRRIGQTYGLTEAGGVVSTGVGSDIEKHPGSSGRLAPVVEARIVDPDTSGAGELLVRSPAAMDGYWGLPDDLTIDAEGWIRTGDIGRVDEDRYLYITGRAKEIIIRGGENVSATAVEAALLKHPAVLEAAVVGLPDPDLGEVVGAVVTTARQGMGSVAELAEWAHKHLAHFAVPARWWLRTDPLPVNDAGKVLKRELVRQWPGSGAATASTSSSASSTSGSG